MLKWLFWPLKQAKLRTKLFWCFIAVALIPLIALSIYAYLIALDSLHTQTQSRVDDYAARVGLLMDTSCERCEEALDDVVYSDQLVALISALQTSQIRAGEVRLFVEEQLTMLHSVSPAFRRADLLYNGDMGLLYNDRELQKTVEQGLAQHPDNAILLDTTGSFWFAEGNWLYILRSVPDLYNDRQLGLMVFTLNKRLFFQEAFLAGGGDIGLLVADNNHDAVISHVQSVMTTGIMPISFLENAQSNLISYNGSQYLFVSAPLQAGNWTVYIIASYDYVQQRTNTIVMVSLVAILAGIVLIALISYLLSSSFVRRIEFLIRQMQEVSSGNWLIEQSAEQGDEIGQLSQAFETMVVELETLVHDVYESKIAQRESEFKALQTQINPHFLYNCLDNMNWYAILRGDDHSSYVITQLSDYYRTSLNRGKNTTTVAEELKNAQAYMNLQLELHDNRFRFEMDVEDGLGDYVTINLMLQPLLENAVKHGVDKVLDKESERLIRLTVRRVGEELRFEVFNTGDVIRPEVLRSVFLEKTRGYGLRNVDERLRLLFGDAYGVKIRGVENGTLCTIVIPLRNIAQMLPEEKEGVQ